VLGQQFLIVISHQENGKAESQSIAKIGKIESCSVSERDSDSLGRLHQLTVGINCL